MALGIASADVFGPRVTFTRVKPADINLGTASRIEVVEFSGVFAESAANELESAAESEGFLTVVLPTFPSATTRRPRGPSSPPPDITIRARIDDCTTRVGTSKRGSEQNNPSASSEYWVDARCSLQAEINDPSGAPITVMNVTGVATSSHGPALSPAMEQEAKENAVRRAGVMAGSRISPRRVTESIRLNRDVPSFDEAYRLIREGSLDKARTLWLSAAHSGKESAGLRYDLAAVCEALGDEAAARANYESAIRLDPTEPKYGESLERLDERSKEAATLRARVVPLPTVPPRSTRRARKR